MSNIDEMRMLRKDVLVTQKDYYEIHKSEAGIIVVDDQVGKEKLNYFEVLKVSKNVTMVKEGDIILLEHLTHTPPQLIDNKMCAVVSEDDIVGVLEHE